MIPSPQTVRLVTPKSPYPENPTTNAEHLSGDKCVRLSACSRNGMVEMPCLLLRGLAPVLSPVFFQFLYCFLHLFQEVEWQRINQPHKTCTSRSLRTTKNEPQCTSMAGNSCQVPTFQEDPGIRPVETGCSRFPLS